MLKSLFFSEKKLLNAILRAKLNYMKKNVFLMKLNVFFAMQKTDFHMFELFLQNKSFKSLKHKIFSLELLRTSRVSRITLVL